PNRLTGLCPFHEERTPSFGINPAEKVYHCFGCQASGDAFTFVMETEGVDFKGALELLADRYKVALELEAEDPRAAEQRLRRERLLELLERTAAFYVRQLWESREAERARAYLAGRGLDEGTLREFRVGYAPSAWDTVLNGSRRAGFGNRELHEAGLAQQSQKTRKIYDRFRSQIIFPLADPRGRVRGFAGRTLGGEDDRRPKYVNSPENDVFHKGRTLFAADLARSAAAKAGFVVAAEGYTDVIAMHQVGVRNCVGIMGTALTDDQLGELARLAPEVRLALDADSAGKEAMLRAARIALARTPPLRLRVVALPPGEDPADLVKRTGGEEIQRLVAQSAPFVRFRVLQALETGNLADAEGRDRVIADLAPVFRMLAPSAESEELQRIAADRLDLSLELLAQLLPVGGADVAASGATSAAAVRAAGSGWSGGARGEPRDGAGARGHGGADGRERGGAPGSRVPAPGGGELLGRREPTERSFLALCIALPQLGGPALAELDLDADLSSSFTRRAAEHLRVHLATPTAGLSDDDPLLAFMRELAVGDARAAAPTRTAFEIERLQLTLARLDREIAAARAAASGDISQLAQLRSTAQQELAGALGRAMDEGAVHG
ncbi:MAG TPA: DNA primase, partial [Solirubrobacteraceae bacterium]|nr:DNA primase [Solirubrobacteraceae bacterium]